ncbi:3,4-dioxygenase subunit beta [Nocardioides sp. LMS-CY]|uniref:Protocatechuate 3,4-dioxygenase beta subunit n=1 Tax=Nocardioides soli TaxID=1036020 RepID=A0A7W4Z3L9_9ACTN|nr:MULTISPECIES: 3,4-dioxygenase subunit beta [Nocardioides]MBB3043850.1 protocatechuate 3,4-dioxygenase beta subunit [Nocardioides soli]QWF20716.1 3,4-dioxygenase subunit beta [Nocardioides sp. LMS-CY]
MTDEREEHDLGLSHDLPRIIERNQRMGRRGMLAVFGAAGVAALAVSCGTDDPETTSGSSAPAGGPGQGGAGGPGAAGAESSVEVAEGEIPEETAGPYPGDGSNGVNVLTESGVVRSDLATSFGSASGVAEGVPVTIRLKVYDLNGEDVTALSGAAVYLWHCDREGRYSMYDEEIKDENYLRGVQETDASGRVEFTSIFPACYDGRWPHLHFEVYRSLADATSYTDKLRTSQLALPQDACEAVYATAGYEQSVANLARVSLDGDMVFADGHSLQLATVTGSVDDGYTIALNVPV